MSAVICLQNWQVHAAAKAFFSLGGVSGLWHAFCTVSFGKQENQAVRNGFNVSCRYDVLTVKVPKAESTKAVKIKVKGQQQRLRRPAGCGLRQPAVFFARDERRRT